MRFVVANQDLYCLFLSGSRVRGHMCPLCGYQDSKHVIHTSSFEEFNSYTIVTHYRKSNSNLSFDVKRRVRKKQKMSNDGWRDEIYDVWNWTETG